MTSRELKNKPQNRNGYDIIAKLLRSCAIPVRKTNMMYEAGISFVLINKYLKMVEKNALAIKKDDDYLITSKGRKYLLTYDELTDFLSADFKELLS